MPRLSRVTLSSIPDHVTVPPYDRGAVQHGIVHIGIGNFHRAHQAVYIDDVLASGDERWGIIGASLRRDDVQKALAPQDYLYSVGIKNDAGTSWRIIGALQSVLYAKYQSRQLIDAMASPVTRIISLTVTEKAYCLDAKSGALDETHPDIIHDFAKPDEPISVIGYLVAGLKARRGNGHPLPALLSCDNLTSNGSKLRNALIRFAEITDRELAKLFEDKLACPSTMVDRIVPQTTDDDRRDAHHALGVEDAWPVLSEPFTQWVMEDRFPLGRPEWEQFGVQCVSDVKPFERMKLSLLNASHTALAILGLLAGYKTVSEAMNNKYVSDFVARFMHEDIAPVLALPAELDCDHYISALLSRFSNPGIHHQLLQIASDSSQKIPQRFIPTVMRRLEAGLPIGRFAYAIAGFLRLLEESHDGRYDLAFKDPEREKLIVEFTQSGSDDGDRIRSLIGHRAIFGDLITHDSAMADIRKALADLRQYGASAAWCG